MLSAANNFLILDSVDSTNKYAMAIIRDGLAAHGNAVFTYTQTQGRGRMGKLWQAETGKNILLSIILSIKNLTIYQQFTLSVAVALACFDMFKKYADDETKIKWPNDIFWNGRKAAGILIENVVKGNNWQWAVIGIGMNINQTNFNSDAAFKPVSLKQITGKEYDVVELARELHKAVMEKCEALQNNEFETMLAAYNQHLFCLDEKVKLKKENAVFETRIKGVSAQGQLITEDVLERKFGFDEVEWLPHPNKCL